MGFFDGAGKSVKFEGVNQGAAGTILPQTDHNGNTVPYIETQQTDFTTKAPATWPDGNPMMQAEVLLQTADRSGGEDDDGVRRLYVQKTRQRRAIQTALTAARAKDLQVGGSLAIWMTGEERTEKGMNAKTFQATYSPPAGGLAVPEAAPAAAAPPVAPPVAAAPAAAAPPVAPPVAAAPPVAPPVAAPVAPPVAPPAAPAAPAAPVAAPVAETPPSTTPGGDELPF